MNVTLIPMVATAILVLVCLFLVIGPYFKDEFNPFYKQAAIENEQIDKKSLLSTLNEIEFDYNMNKISEEDYKKLTRHYEKMIAEQMQVVEQTAASPVQQVEEDLLREIELEIEKELASQLQRKGGR